MTAKEIFVLALRVVGLWAAIHGVIGLPATIAGIFYAFGFGAQSVDFYPAYTMIVFYVPPVIYCVVAIVLLLFAPRLASFFYREQAVHDSVRANSANLTDVYRIAAQLLGIYAFLQVVPSLAKTMVWFASSEARQFRTANGTEIVQGILYLACSVYLICGSRRIAGWLVKIRTYPEPKDGEHSNSTMASDSQS